MPFTYDDWLKRIANRNDITAVLTHLTKPNQADLANLTEDEINIKAVDNLIKILKDKKLNGSNTQIGFIVGSTPAVCFQDTPFYSLMQNIEYEKRIRQGNPNGKIRYCGVGVAFNKFYIFTKGGRPVLYEKTEIAKKILDKNEHWRIVNHQLDIENPNIIDWTHEREWRVPQCLEFDIENTCVILYNKKCVKYFSENCPKEISQNLDVIINLKAFIM